MQAIKSDYNHMSEIEYIRGEFVSSEVCKQNVAQLFKVIILGDASVGKSSVLMRLTKDVFDDKSEATIGVEFGDSCMKIEDSYLKMQIWDTAGQESFRSITKIFYKTAQAVILCYAINNRKTFEQMAYWLNEIREQCAENIMIFLVGTKLDLESEREVSRESALRLQREYDIKYWCETSAKSGDNINQLFLDAGKFFYNNEMSHPSENNSASDYSRSNSETSHQPNDLQGNYNGLPNFGGQQSVPNDKIVLKPETFDDLPVTNKNKKCKC